MMPALPDEADEAVSSADWERLRAIRDTVNRQLERLRVAGAIGSALDAEVDLYVNADDRALLDKLNDELRFALICSYARVHADTARPTDTHADADLWLTARASAHPKCVRCWHHRDDVGSNTGHPELCGRCVENVAGPGERRRFA